MTYAPVNGLRLYYEIHGSGRPLVLLHGGLTTIDLDFGSLLAPLAAGRQVIAVELQGHGHTADPGREMTMEALAGDVVGLLDRLGVAQADFVAMQDAYAAGRPGTGADHPVPRRRLSVAARRRTCRPPTGGCGAAGT
jgi:hypothetical protein